MKSQTGVGRTLRMVGFGLLSVVVLFGGTAHGGWQPIIGIPEPPFGVNEVAPATPNPWDRDVAGFYYVQEGGTNPGNGYPANPRGTIPTSSIPAGSVIEIHGQINSGGGITSSGTAASPIFFRSTSYASRSKITDGVGPVNASYLIFENLHFGPLDSADTGFGFGAAEGSHHIAVRSSEFSGNLNRSGGLAFGTWQYTGSSNLTYVVLDNVFIHDIGDVNSPVDQDAHGITLNGRVQNFWFTHSTVTGCSGDGIQINGGDGDTTRNAINHIYVGKVESHHNKQTGMWIKEATDVIFSQNKIHGFVPGNSSSGQCTGQQYGPGYTWFIFNEIYDCGIGISIESGLDTYDADYTFAIGNVIHGVHSATPSNPHLSGAIKNRGGKRLYVVNNTAYDADAFVNILYSPPSTEIYNNIFSTRYGTSAYDILVENTGSTTYLDNNIIYGPSVRISWNGATYSGLAAFQSATGKCASCVNSDPNFVNATSGNFSIQSPSPAIDKGSLQSVYATFRSRYGIDISEDTLGAPRPQGAAWDIGAYEYNSGVALRTPNPPYNLQIH